MGLFTSTNFVDRVQKHFGGDVSGCAIINQGFEEHEHADLHLAVEKYVFSEGRSAQLLGLVEQGFFRGLRLSDLLVQKNPATGLSIREGPVRLINLQVPDGKVLSCVESGIYLVKDGKKALAILIQANQDRFAEIAVRVEIMAADRASGERALTEVRDGMRQRSLYRGHVLSVAQQDFPRTLQIRFHALPPIAREQLVLPHGLLERIERQTLEFGRYREKLRAAGRHLKRGILLHGPPGTGKTLTAMYLVSALKDHTVLLVTPRGLGAMERVCGVARTLAPSVVVIEDIDLVAEDRSRPGATCSAPLLFELLNEMDGLGDDMDVLFLLTTNRPDVLEPALAARPGRIDQAFEIPLPDAYCRRKLFELYSQGLSLKLTSLDPYIKRTKNAGGAFIRELMRKAAVFAAADGSEIVIEDFHLEEALQELVVHGQEVTKSLLGFRSGPGPVD